MNIKYNFAKLHKKVKIGKNNDIYTYHNRKKFEGIIFIKEKIVTFPTF